MFIFQIELVSPGFQTPRSLGLFCSAHFALVAAVDVAVGTFVQVEKKISINWVFPTHGQGERYGGGMLKG